MGFFIAFFIAFLYKMNCCMEEIFVILFTHLKTLVIVCSIYTHLKHRTIWQLLVYTAYYRCCKAK